MSDLFSALGLTLLVTASTVCTVEAAEHERPIRAQSPRSEAKSPRRAERTPRKDAAKKAAAAPEKKPEEPDDERWISVYPADPQ